MITKKTEKASSAVKGMPKPEPKNAVLGMTGNVVRPAKTTTNYAKGKPSKGC
jgi:hypothetical protein